MVVIRDIREKDYHEMARIWRDVLDKPVTDECLAEAYGKMGKGGAHHHANVTVVIQNDHGKNNVEADYGHAQKEGQVR